MDVHLSLLMSGQLSGVSQPGWVEVVLPSMGAFSPARVLSLMQLGPLTPSLPSPNHTDLKPPWEPGVCEEDVAVSGGRMESKVVCLFFLAQRWFCKIKGIYINGRKVQKVYLRNGEALGDLCRWHSGGKSGFISEALLWCLLRARRSSKHANTLNSLLLISTL